MDKVKITFTAKELEVLISLASLGEGTIQRTKHASSQRYVIQSRCMILKLKRILGDRKSARARTLSKKYSIDNVKPIK